MGVLEWRQGEWGKKGTRNGEGEGEIYSRKKGGKKGGVGREEVGREKFVVEMGEERRVVRGCK